MSKQIIKKDNGLYAIWSTIIDDFIVDDCTMEDIIEINGEEAKEFAIKDTIKIFEQLKNNQNPYYQSKLTYEEALEQRAEYK